MVGTSIKGGTDMAKVVGFHETAGPEVLKIEEIVVE
jgi:hypothetical protein